MQCHRAVRQELSRDVWCVTMCPLSLGLAAMEALSPGRGHMGQSHVRGDPAAEMCPGFRPAVESLGGGQWVGWALNVGCPCLHGSKGHVWWLSSRCPAALCTWHWLHVVVPACTRVSTGATLPLTMVQPGRGEGCQSGSAVAWPAGQGDSAGSFIVTQVLPEPWMVPCSPSALLSYELAVGDSFLQQTRAQSCFLHWQTLDVKTLLEFVWVTLQCSHCLALNQPCAVWSLLAALLSQ